MHDASAQTSPPPIPLSERSKNLVVWGRNVFWVTWTDHMYLLKKQHNYLIPFQLHYLPHNKSCKGFKIPSAASDEQFNCCTIFLLARLNPAVTTLWPSSLINWTNFFWKKKPVKMGCAFFLFFAIKTPNCVHLIQVSNTYGILICSLPMSAE